MKTVLSGTLQCKVLCAIFYGMKGTEWTTQLRKGTLEFCILALIAQKPRYGYDLVTALGVWPALQTAEGTLYPLLRRLQKDGLLEANWQESASGPPRKYYRLSAGGTEALEQLNREWQALTAAVDDLLSAEPSTETAAEAAPLEVAQAVTEKTPK